MTKKIVDVTDKYSHELQEIKNKLQRLENGRIYELTRVQMDGYLSTNVSQLKRMIASLIDKIEYGKDSVEDEFSEAFGKIDR
ncbi:hypothetical protein [Metabacillus rhizolycopersici]|uniref:Antitoxin n=1 Tax=Metabacillus rhizolycopersici TaxID=2875709 RepID=A0ABS7UV58_9BACI|nr:hypothetical protein [Metabacillus rhizolycopersici]MBZ5752173.1 hypothetical protein [Metabacillus rhizolycopersici]